MLCFIALEASFTVSKFRGVLQQSPVACADLPVLLPLGKQKILFFFLQTFHQTCHSVLLVKCFSLCWHDTSQSLLISQTVIFGINLAMLLKLIQLCVQ